MLTRAARTATGVVLSRDRDGALEHMRKRFRIGGALLAAGLLVLAYYQYAPRHAPYGQPALTQLTPQNFAEFQKAFNDAAGDTRLLVLLSPT